MEQRRRKLKRKRWWKGKVFRTWLLRSFVGTVTVLAVAVIVLLARPDPVTQDYIERALTFERKGKLNEAVKELKAALLLSPDSVDARWMLSGIYIKQRDGAGALAQLTKARELGFEGQGFTYRLIRALLLERQFNEALARLAFMKTAPEDPTVFLLRGQARLGLDRSEKALDAFNTVLQLNPANAEAHYGVSATKLSLGDYEGADKGVDIALELDPNNLLGWMLKGEIAMVRQDAPGAQRAFEAALALEHRNIVPRLMLAQALIAQNKTEQANVHIAQVLKDRPEDSSANFVAAQAALADNDLDAARDAMYISMKMEHSHPQSLLLMGWIGFLKMDSEIARKLLNDYLTFEPGDPTATKLLATILLREGQIPQAIEVLASATAAGDPELLAMLGSAYLKTGEYVKAEALLGEAHSLAPDSAPTRTQLALSWLAAGEIERGTKELESVVNANPEYVRAHLLLALVQYLTRDYADAFANSASLAQKIPENPLPLILMGAIHEDKGHIDLARELYQQGLDLAPDNVIAMYNLARLSWTDGEIELARERFHSVLLAQPGHLPTLRALAQIALDTNRPEDALSFIEQAREANPNTMEVRLDLASIYVQQGRAVDALSVAEEAANLAPDNTAVMQALARSQLAVGQVSRAQTTFGALVARLPNSADAHFEHAQAQRRGNNLKGAKTSLQKALALAPDRADIRASFGTLVLADGKLDEALGIAREIQRAHPQHADGYLLEGDVLMTRQQPHDAVVAYESALARSRTQRSVMKLQAAYRQAGNTAKADNLLRARLNVHPEDQLARMVLTKAMVQAEDFGPATKELERAVQYQPDNGIILNDLAWLYGQVDDPKALTVAERAYELLPDHPEILDTYGWLLAENNDVDKGLTLLERAVLNSPDNPQIRYHFAATLARSGQGKRARDELEVILNSDQTIIDPQELKRMIADLE